MAKQSSSPPSGGSGGGNPVWQMVNEEVQKTQIFPTDKQPLDGTNVGDIAKRASEKLAEGKDFSDILTGSLDETDQSASVQIAKVITGGQRGVGIIDDAERKLEMCRKDFLNLCVLGTLAAVGSSIINGFGGILRFLMGITPSGGFLTGLNPNNNSNTNTTVVQGQVFSAGIAIGMRFSDEDLKLIEKEYYPSKYQPYTLSVVESVKDLYSGKMPKQIFLSGSRKYPTPEGEKRSKLIVAEYSGFDLETYRNVDQRFNQIRARCNKKTIIATTTYDGRRAEGYALDSIEKSWLSGEYPQR